MTDRTFVQNGHKRAVLYARVSHEEQAGAGKASIPEQIAEMQARCGLQEWQVLGDFVDDKDYKATQSPKRGKMVNPSGERASPTAGRCWSRWRRSDNGRSHESV